MTQQDLSICDSVPSDPVPRTALVQVTTRPSVISPGWDFHYNLICDQRLSGRSHSSSCSSWCSCCADNILQSDSDLFVWYDIGNSDDLWAPNESSTFFNELQGDDEPQLSPRSLSEFLNFSLEKDVTGEVRQKVPSLAKMDPKNPSHFDLVQLASHTCHELLELFFNHLVIKPIATEFRPLFLRRFLHGKYREIRLVRSQPILDIARSERYTHEQKILDFYLALAEEFVDSLTLATHFEIHDTMRFLITLLDPLRSCKTLTQPLGRCYSKRSRILKENFHYRRMLSGH